MGAYKYLAGTPSSDLNGFLGVEVVGYVFSAVFNVRSRLV